jgi:hypothetical protein
MSRAGDLMRKSLKRFVVPRLHDLGFEGARSNFRRVSDEKLDFLDVQYWKYGGALVLEFARTNRGDFQTSWGPIVPEADLTLPHLSPMVRARLKSLDSDTSYPFGWFRFDAFGEATEKYDALAREIAELLPQADAWLRTGEQGPRVFPFHRDPGAVA